MSKLNIWWMDSSNWEGMALGLCDMGETTVLEAKDMKNQDHKFVSNACLIPNGIRYILIMNMLIGKDYKFDFALIQCQFICTKIFW